MLPKINDPAARRIPVLPLLRQDIFLGRKENGMTMYAKENVIAASLGAVFVGGSSVSVSELSVFHSDHCFDISWFF